MDSMIAAMWKDERKKVKVRCNKPVVTAFSISHTEGSQTTCASLICHHDAQQIQQEHILHEHARKVRGT